MSKVIRMITYEGDPDNLELQLDHSLLEGECEFVSPVKITVRTLFVDAGVKSYKLHRDNECTSPCVDNYCPVHGIAAQAARSERKDYLA